MNEKNNISTVSVYTITRIFDAPRQLVWDAWTKPEHVKHWMGPEGTSGTVFNIEFKVGGVNHYCLKSPDGSEMWGMQKYREIDPPKKLVTIQSFSDADQNVTRHPMAPDWPLETLSTCTFEEMDGKTKLTLVWIPYNATAKEIEIFNSAHESMNGGWGGSFAKLDSYLAKVQK